MSNHLNHQQFCDLLIDSTPNAASSAHLASCPECAAEFSTLEASLGLFRQASIQLAEQTIDRRPLLLPKRRHGRFLSIPAYIAAAAMLAVVLFIPLLRSGNDSSIADSGRPAAVTTASASPAESDEALFDEINQDIAASVPSPMEPLANPTGMSNQGSSR
jgi:anti-sigma factor RsiW